MNRTQLLRIGLPALLVAWCFDQLFWQKTPGVSFPVFVLLYLLLLAWVTWREQKRPAPASLVLFLPALFFAALSFLRQEPFTTFVNYALTLGCLCLATLTWQGGRWWQYALLDYAHNTAWLAGTIIVKPLEFFFTPQSTENDRFATGAALRAEGSPSINAGGAATPHSQAASRRRFALPILGGLALAAPVVAVLGLLLASADPIFSQYLSNVLNIFRIERFDEYVFRIMYILVLAYTLCGILLHALLSSRNEKLGDPAKPRLAPFIGWIQACTVLTCVDLLFTVFVAIQFRYFFGGQANITLAGYTYSEYARRGFGELLAVALLSLLLFLSLSQATRHATPATRRLFAVLGSGLVALVTVILVSAFQRLMLYEAAYGFTRLRLYTHIFMLWLGLVLVCVAGLEWAGRLRYFALAAMLATLGFGVTLNLVNVDGYIVRQNVTRATQGSELDIATLANLSADALPELATSFHSPALSAALRERVGAALACSRGLAHEAIPGEPGYQWQSYTWPQSQAARLFQAEGAALEKYPLSTTDQGLVVEVGGQEAPCSLYGD